MSLVEQRAPVTPAAFTTGAFSYAAPHFAGATLTELAVEWDERQPQSPHVG